MPIEPIESRRLYRQVADHLRQLITRGEFATGGRLPAERDLAEQLGVSRPTVREALIALEVEGRVRIRVGSGVYVVDPPSAGFPPPPGATPIEGPFELLRARELIEGSIAEEAALMVTPEHIAVLDDLLARMHHSAHPTRETLQVDRQFHTAVAGIIGNGVLVRFVGELFDQRINPYFEKLSRYFENADTWRLAFGEHQAIRDAIVARDPQLARNAMRHHLAQSQIRFQTNFEEIAPASTSGETLSA